MKRKDIVLICIVLMIACIFYAFLQITAKSGDEVVVTVEKKEVLKVPLSKDKELTVPLTDGKNIIVIKDRSVFMKQADCPDQICVRHKPITKSGETIVCLPHKVVVEIKTHGKSDVDIMAQ